MQVALYTLGCKVNQFDTDIIAQSFHDRGIDIVPFNKRADIYVINTCTVTARAAYQSRQMIRRAFRQNPGARIIATGCYVQADACSLFEKVPPQVCLVGNDSKSKLVEFALRHPEGLECYVGDIYSCKSIAPELLVKPLERTRAFIRIQDGCNAFCSYCIVPYTRGPSRSLDPYFVLKQLDILKGSGVQEVVLTGIHLGAYGLDLKPVTTILDLLKEICASDLGMRIRISSIEPSEVEPDLISLIKFSGCICHHLHLPLQSGSKVILSRMGRHYSPDDYARLVLNIKSELPDAAIGADVLVGFPGETEEDFAKTFDFLSSLPITYIHAFPFSPRPGTVAETFPDRIPGPEKSKRVKALRKLSSEKRVSFYNNFIGQELSCLVESRPTRDGYLRAMSDNYVPVLIENNSGNQGLVNKIVRIKIKRVDAELVFGEPCC